MREYAIEWSFAITPLLTNVSALPGEIGSFQSCCMCLENDTALSCYVFDIHKPILIFFVGNKGCIIGPILWGHSGPLCHALSLSLWTSILHCHSPGVTTVTRRQRYSNSWLRLILVVVSTVATPGEWQCKIRTGGVRRLAVANRPNIFQMLLVKYSVKIFFLPRHFCVTPVR